MYVMGMDEIFWKRPKSKADHEMSLDEGSVPKSEENKYHDIKKPALRTGADNTAYMGDTAGYGTGVANSSEASKAVPFENESEGVGADMMENALYEASDSASGQGVHGGTSKVQLLGVTAKFLISREDSTPKMRQEVASSKSIPPYAQVNKVQSHMVDNELYGETVEDDRHPMPGAYDSSFKDSSNLQTEKSSALYDGMIDNEVYAPSPDDAIYHELEEDDQQEVTLEGDFCDDGMVDNALYSESAIDHEGDQGGMVYENTEYHDVPKDLVENELYNL